MTDKGVNSVGHTGHATGESGKKPLSERDAGRPTKLTPARHARIIDLIKNGNYIDVACAATGIDSRSFYQWTNRGRQLDATYNLDRDMESGEQVGDDWELLTPNEQCYVRFFQDITKANAEAEATAVLHVRNQMPKNWAAAMTFLERKHPGRWKRRDEVTVQTPFDPSTQQTSGVDEAAMLKDPEAIALMHDALVMVSRGELPPGPEADPLKEEEIIDATVVDDVSE